MVAHLLAAEHRQAFLDQLAYVDVVQPVVEIEIVALPLQVAGKARPLVDQLAELADVGRTGRGRRLHGSVAVRAPVRPMTIGLPAPVALAVVGLEEGADDAVPVEGDEGAGLAVEAGDDAVGAYRLEHRAADPG